MRRLALLPSALLLVCANTPPPAVPKIGYRIAARFPHDTDAFTEGLLMHGGFLYESTGLEGQSDIRRVRLSDGKVLKSVKLPPEIFGEGIVDWGKELLSVTWKTGLGFRWDMASLKRKARFSYPGEGWGMTQDGKNIILSDGTPNLRVLNPVTFAEVRRITVTFNGKPLPNLNELEWVKGVLYANVWQQPAIVRIDPSSGRVTGVLDLTDLAASVNASGPDAVLNGIAYDVSTAHLLVTGKNWPTLFSLALTDD
jgi:glutaminyl-peptide cyclotransferase